MEREKINRRPKLEDVANKVGVSQKSASIALRGLPGVSDELRNQINNAAESLGYRPPHAWALKEKQSTGMVGFLAGQTDRHTTLVIDSLILPLMQEGYSLALQKASGTRQALKEQIHRMANNYNGVILFNPPDILNPSDFRSRLPKPTLVVGSNNRLTENGLFETLSESGEEAGKIAINYLASLGHKEIAYLGDAPDGGSLFLERRKGIEEAMRDNGIASRIRIFGTLHNNLNSDFGYSQMNGIIQLRNCPTAILAGSEFIAAGVMKAITEAGLSVPRDISVMAFGGESYENYLSPKLTSVEVSSDQLAAAQVRWVLKSIKQKPGYQGAGLEKPTPMLTIRESTGKAPNVEV